MWAVSPSPALPAASAIQLAPTVPIAAGSAPPGTIALQVRHCRHRRPVVMRPCTVLRYVRLDCTTALCSCPNTARVRVQCAPAFGRRRRGRCPSQWVTTRCPKTPLTRLGASTKRCAHPAGTAPVGSVCRAPAAPTARCRACQRAVAVAHAPRATSASQGRRRRRNRLVATTRCTARSAVGPPSPHCPGN